MENESTAENIRKRKPISLKEAEKEIDFSISTLRNWRNDGKPEHIELFVKAEGKLFFNIEEWYRRIDLEIEKNTKDSKRLRSG